jgi:sugar O-acyltransferase (sialic acid O-acetyltransferase NeuD family)
MLKLKLIIVGAGGHGRALAEAVNLKNDFELVGFVDDSWPDNTLVWKYPILGKIADLSQYREKADWAVVAIGNNKLRSELTARLIDVGFEIATVVHPASIVSPSAVIGCGTVIMAGAIIGTEAKLGIGVIVNSGANVDHHCVVGDFGHLGVNACMAGGSSLGVGTWIQAGSALGYGVKVAPSTVILAGIGVN